MQPNQVLSKMPVQTPDTQTVPAAAAETLTPSVVVSDVKKVVSEVSKDWKSPSFWVHLAVQIATWVGFFSTSNSSIKVGALTLSGASILGYLTHLSFVKKYL